jgi:hypothetical protein
MRVPIRDAIIEDGDLDEIFDMLQEEHPDAPIEAVKKYCKLEKIQTTDADFDDEKTVKAYRAFMKMSFAVNYGRDIPHKAAVDEIVDFIGKDTCLSVGCYKGMLERILELRGIKIHATDPGYEYAHAKELTYTKVENLDPRSAITKYGQCFPISGSMEPMIICNVLIEGWSSRLSIDLFQGDKYILLGAPTADVPRWPGWNVKEIYRPTASNFIVFYERAHSFIKTISH